MFSTTNDNGGRRGSGAGGNDEAAFGTGATGGVMAGIDNSDSMGAGFDDDDEDGDDPFNVSVGQDLFEKMMNDSTEFKFNNSSHSLGDQDLTAATMVDPYHDTSNTPTTATPSSSSRINTNNDGLVGSVDPMMRTGGNNQMFGSSSNNNNNMDSNDVGEMNPEALLAELDYMEPTIYEYNNGPRGGGPVPMGTPGMNRMPAASRNQNNLQQQQQLLQQQNQFRTPSNNSGMGRNANWTSMAGGPGGDGVRPAATALDAAPLNIALGGGLLARGGASVFSNSLMQRKGSNPSLHSFNRKGSNPSLHNNYNRKGSNPSLHNFNHKVQRASRKSFKSSKSEGLLARALKAKYGSSSRLASFNMNAEQAAAAIVQNSRGSLSEMNAMGGGNGRGSLGAQNATWGSNGGDDGGGMSRASGSTSSIQRLLLSKTSNSISSKMSRLASAESASAMFNAKLKLAPSGASRSSMQDLLRQSRKQSKTQSVLRQSSAQSLMRKSSLPSLHDPSGKVDVSSLLRPQHVGSRKSLNKLSFSEGIQLDNSSMTGRANASFDIPTNSNNAFATGQNRQPLGQESIGTNMETLLHQSCRLYPTTDAVVESALRVDPDAVRRPVSGEGKNTYGYPINVALTHGASTEVLAMLINAGPDVLVKKDGSDGSGSLGVALAAKWDLNVIGLLLGANRECASVADRRGNYPLHVAVSAGIPLETVKRVLVAYPQAQEMRNFHSQTPLEIAQRSTRVGEDVVGFLQATALTLQSDGMAGSIVHRSQGNLEEGLDDIMETNFG